MTTPVRVRFAPSPTGPLHIGGVRTALYNYLFARQHGGQFILRIEDTDQNRYVPGAEEYIIESLDWCGIKFDEGVTGGGPYGPYRQSERKEQYRPYAEQLVRDGKAYYAFDTPAELEKEREEQKKISPDAFQYDSKTRLRLKNSLTLTAGEVKRRLDAGEPYVIRICIPADQVVKLTDIIRGDVSVHTNILDDKVLFKSDGMPTYHLANVVDDHLMKITHVIRGEEWLPSAPMHVLLYRYLGWEDTMPQFAHLPLLLKPDGNGKLSKRDGDRLGFPVFPLKWTDPASGEVSSGYREAGYLPEAFINFLAMLGWNPGVEQELFNFGELASIFSLERVHKAGAKFDFEKAKWFNQQYIKKLPDPFLAGLLSKALVPHGIEAGHEYLEKVCGLIKERITFLNDLWDYSCYFFEDPRVFDQETIRKRWKPETPGIIASLAAELEAVDFSAPDLLEGIFHQFLEKNSLGTGAAMSPLRLVVTGKAGGPGMFEIMHLIGKESTLRRMHGYRFE
ncbi:MAG: glutamate--tRNA ligase [Bacteroidetes bacterium]|nr:glutamate--tRNA ligase [Bacteroidota bacterium]